MYCSSCGNKFNDGDAFCVGCGKQVGAVEKPTSSTQQPSEIGSATQNVASRQLSNMFNSDNSPFIMLLATCIVCISLFFFSWFGISGRNHNWGVNTLRTVSPFNFHQVSAAMDDLPTATVGLHSQEAVNRARRAEAFQISFALLYIVPLINVFAIYKLVINGNKSFEAQINSYRILQLVATASAFLVCYSLLQIARLNGVWNESITLNAPMILAIVVSILQFFLARKMKSDLIKRENIEVPILTKKMKIIIGSVLGGIVLLPTLLATPVLILVLAIAGVAFIFMRKYNIKINFNNIVKREGDEE